MNQANLPVVIEDRMATRFGVNSSEVRKILAATAFKIKEGVQPTQEQMTALMIVADQYGLNPFTKEIYAFPDKQNGIVPVVGIDGWSRIINDHPKMDGLEFFQSETSASLDASAKPCPEWMGCRIYRKDRSHPICVKEYADEAYRPAYEKKEGGKVAYSIKGAWQSHTKRMLRHKAMIQCARVAFGFGGIYDEDEAERIIQNLELAKMPSLVEMPKAKQPEVVDAEFNIAPSDVKAAIVSIEKQFDILAEEVISNNQPSANINNVSTSLSGSEVEQTSDNSIVGLSEGMLRVLNAKLEAKKITMDALVNGYGHVTAANINKAFAWIGQQEAQG